MKKSYAIYSLLLFCMFMSCHNASEIDIDHLTVEMKVAPKGIESTTPRFSWQLSSKRPDLQQVAYQIQVSDSPENIKSGKNLVWDSGITTSDQSVLVAYGGPALQSQKKYYWRVKLTTNQGKTSWSKSSEWSMAILDKSEWKAKWIGENMASNPGESMGRDPKGKKGDNSTRLAARYLRKEFPIDKTVKRATLYVSGLGSSDSYVNGSKVSDDVFAPMPSQYAKRVYYNVYDVTDLMANGKNTLGVVLGNGRFFSMRTPGMTMFGLPRLLAQLQIEYNDGSEQTIATDETWRVTSKGPIVANNEFDGEEYDARLELPRWNMSGYDESTWKNADIMEAPEGQLVAQQNPNICVQESVRPIAIMVRPDGKYILDMGQNMVGWLAVKLKGKKDKPIVMRFAEILQPDSTLYVANLRTAKATDVYTPNADGQFAWEPSFVYHGFRYVEIDGLDYEPALDDFAGKVIYDKMATSGTFECSDSLVNRIHKNAYWGIRGNYRGMPTDCPQRDERLGWLGDRATGCYGEAFIFDNAQLYAKWLQDIEDSMSPEGVIPDVCPAYWQIYSRDVTWPSAFFYGADMMNRQYGDDMPIKTHYAAMKNYMRMVQDSTMKDYIVTRDTYGDWCMPPESQELIHSKDPARVTDGEILSTTVYYDLLNKMKDFAVIAGEPQDTSAYVALAAKVKDAYNKKFFDPSTARYGNNTVTANILSLRLGLVPSGYEDKVARNIVDKTNTDFGGHVSTGVLGIQHLMRGLTETGNLDLAYKILTNETYPSWGYMVKNNATTIWELWNGNTADPAMNSANHVMLLGDLIIWYYENLSGIKNAPQANGYKKIVMNPVYPQGLDYVTATYDSPYGKIKSAWKRKGSDFEWNVSVPGNSSAVVCIPKDVKINNINSMPGVRNVKDGAEYMEVEIGSGNYSFVSGRSK